MKNSLDKVANIFAKTPNLSLMSSILKTKNESSDQSKIKIRESLLMKNIGLSGLMGA